MTCDEWFADYLRRVQRSNHKRARLFREELPQHRDRPMQAQRRYDAETDELRRLMARRRDREMETV